MQYKLHIFRILFVAIFACCLLLVPNKASAQEPAQSEATINDEYHDIIMRYLRNDIAKRQASMNNRAQQLLQELPLDERLYDENEVHISAKMVNDTDADGRPELNYVITLTYSSNTQANGDDYASGQYLVERSNSAKAICAIAKAIVEEDNADIFAPGRQVTMRIASATDAEAIKHLDYNGEYGDFRYAAVQHNGRNIRISVNEAEGISTNEQLAFLRAQGLRECVVRSVNPLQSTDNSFIYNTRCFSEKGSQYRRCGIEFTVHKPFDELMASMYEKLVNDEFIEYNIPQGVTGSKDHTFVVIIANEAYEAPLPNCEYAYRDGQVMKEYFVHTIGVPERHVRVLNNVSIAQIQKKGVKWLKDITTAMGGDANIVVYYSGHGLTDATYRPYLIPCGMDLTKVKSWAGKSEIDPTLNLNKHDQKALMAQCLPLDTLCSWFDRVATNNLTFILDASFNGIQRDGEELIEIEKTVERMKGLRLRGDICIFAAANFDKTAYAFEEQKHGFLTYFMLKEMKRTKGNITYGELYKKLKKEISYESSLQGKLQEPIMILGGKMKDGWEGLTF